MFPLPSRRAARRPRPRSRCTSCRALRHPARNDDLFDVGHLLLGERARAGWRRGRRRTCRGGLCPDCASRRCAPCPLRSASESTGPARQIARRAGVPPAPPGGRRPACRRSAPRSPFSGGARPSMCRFAAGRGRGGGKLLWHLPLAASLLLSPSRADLSASSILIPPVAPGRLSAARLERSADLSASSILIPPVAPGRLSAACLASSILIPRRAPRASLRLGLRRREPAGHRGRLPPSFPSMPLRRRRFSATTAAGSSRMITRPDRGTILESSATPVCPWSPCGGAAAGRPAALQDPALQGHALTLPLPYVGGGT